MMKTKMEVIWNWRVVLESTEYGLMFEMVSEPTFIHVPIHEYTPTPIRAQRPPWAPPLFGRRGGRVGNAAPRKPRRKLSKEQRRQRRIARRRR